MAVFCDGGAAAQFSLGIVEAGQERLIHGDPALVRASREVTAAYSAAFRSLSASSRAELRQEQQQWLKFARIVCRTTRGRSASRSRAYCLEDLYGKRKNELEDIAKTGNIVIRRVVRYSFAASAGPGSGGAYPGLNTTVIEFPQIDNPVNQPETEWNELIAHYKHRGQALATVSAFASTSAEDDGDLLVDYVLGSVSPSMISLRLVIYDDAHGAHGTASEEGITWLLGEGRALRSEDVFDARQSWNEYLANIVLRKIQGQANGATADLNASDIVDQVSDPRHWLIQEHELTVRFNIEGAPSCCATVEAEIPWRALKPYLKSPLPFPIVLD
jgi:hypothetical protein